MPASPGTFDPEGNLVIDTPRTPGSWYNYLFNDDTFLHFTQCGQGPSWIRQPVIRRWNRGNRYLYIRDGADGSAWCPTWTPLGVDPDSYRCTHAPCWSRIEAERNGIAVGWRAFVPREGQRELWTLEVANTTAGPRALDAFVAIGLDDAVHMGWEARWREEHGMLVKLGFPLHADYDDYARLRELPNHTCVAPTRAPDSWAADEESFFGHDAPGAVPAAVAAGRCSEARAVTGQPLAALHYHLELPPRGEWRGHFLVGCTADPAAFAAARDDFSRAGAVADELAAVENAWRETARRVSVTTPDADLDRWLNLWLKKELVWETRLWRNDISSPWRNELQDAMGYACFDPAAALPYLEAVTRGQRADGYLQVWDTRDGEPAPNHPLVTKRHVDGGIWLTICWCAAAHAAGDIGWLDRELPFADGGDAPVLEHLRRAVEHTAGLRGAHDLVLMLDGDWTDPINGPGRDGKGESGWATLALAYGAGQLADLARSHGDNELATRCEALRDELNAAANAALWLGDRYAYGYDDAGHRFGDADDGRTWLNVQTWAIISGAATGKRAAAVRRAIEGLMTPCGPVLLDPPFAGWDPVVGRLSLKPAGLGENASVYCHGGAFAAFALAKLRDGDAACDLVVRTLPTNPDHPPAVSGQPPIIQPNAYLAERGSPQFGRGSRSLGTGTCTWLYTTVLDEILGVRARVDGLELDPLLPRDWPEARVERVVRGCRYRVHLLRDLRVDEVMTIEVDGAEQSGNLVAWREAETCDVVVRLPEVE